jgi:phosphoglycerate dehydrogenase-like enzyme
MPKIFYTSHAPEEVYDIIRAEMPAGFELVTLERDDDAERREKIAGCEVVIVAATPLRADVLAAGKKLRLVHHQGVGWHDTLPVAEVKARGLSLALTPEGTTVGVAEHAILLMLAVCKLLPHADSELRQGRWHVNALRPRSRELFGRTIGYVGMGRIGQAVAERLKAFGTRGLYVDDVPLAAEREAALGVARAPLDRVLAESDVVTLHVPLTATTRHMIDAAALARMKRGAILVNTSRGGLVDEAALFAALESGKLAGAGLDVFEKEPLPGGSPLARLDNVVLTPHISAGTRDALATKMAAVAANIARFYAGETLRNEVAL